MSDSWPRLAAPLTAAVEAGDLAGGLVMVWQGGVLRGVEAVGQRDLDAGLPMHRDTLFRIASMTKPMVSVLALMLLEEGRLALETPVRDWLPELEPPGVLTQAEGPLDNLAPLERPLTLEDLLTQRAGIAYPFTAAGPIKTALEALPSWETDPQAWLEALGRLPLTTQPGAAFQYGFATDLLGLIVARIEGAPLETVMQARILGPLGMTDTAFHCPAEKTARLARVYTPDLKNGGLRDVTPRTPTTPPRFASGGGGLISTADDYLAFARMLMGGGEVDGVRLLRPETVAMMTANRLTPEQRRIPFMGIPFWMGQGFGLGVSVITDPARQAWMGAGSAGAFGWPGILGTWWQADPAKDLILIYLVQNQMPTDPASVAQLATGQRLGARAALPAFQKLVYAKA